MGRVILDLSMSLDGFVAGTSVDAGNPLGDGGDRLHDWMFSSGTETGRAIERETFASAGAIVMGRRTFDLGKPHWDPDPQTFRRLPVFVLTHRPREPVADPGGSTFTFVSDGIDSVLAQARTAADGRDVVLGGGASLGRQFLTPGSLTRCGSTSSTCCSEPAPGCSTSTATTVPGSCKPRASWRMQA